MADRQHRLGDAVGEWTQAGAEPADEHDRAHQPVVVGAVVVATVVVSTAVLPGVVLPVFSVVSTEVVSAEQVPPITQ
jgi:hypothetical protein